MRTTHHGAAAAILFIIVVSAHVSAIIENQCTTEMSYQHPEWVAVTDSESLLLESYFFEHHQQNVALALDPKNFTFYPLQQLDNSTSYYYRVDQNNSGDDPRRSHDCGSFSSVQSCWQRFVDSCFRICMLLVSLSAYYDSLLNTYPAVTKSVTAGVVSFLGDLLAQAFEHLLERHARRRRRTQQQRSGSSSKQRRRKQPFDVHRSFTVAAEGLFISGPILHYAYDHMEQAILDFRFVWWLESIVQVCFDILVLDSIFTATLMVTSAILQGRTRQQLVRELCQDYVPAVRVAWVSSLTMSPLQFVNFGLIPLRFRVLVTNFQDVIWNASVSYMAHRSRTKKENGTY